MHSRSEMWYLCTAYCIMIKTLVEQANRRDRALRALDALRTYADEIRPRENSELINEFIAEAA